MIVKNEQDGIRACLESVKPYIGYYVISDTGSTDSTMDIIREVLDGIPSVLRQDEWVNFGHARSHALALARNTATWILALDADMTVEIDPDFEPDLAVEAYMIRMGSADFSYRLPLLLRGDIEWKSVGLQSTNARPALTGGHTPRSRPTRCGSRCTAATGAAERSRCGTQDCWRLNSRTSPTMPAMSTTSRRRAWT